jgi:hypothetical protein
MLETNYIESDMAGVVRSPRPIGPTSPRFKDPFRKGAASGPDIILRSVLLCRSLLAPVPQIKNHRIRKSSLTRNP